MNAANLRLRFFKGEYAVCALRDLSRFDLSRDLFFLSKTPDELSLVCAAECVPANAGKVEGGWTLFRVEGVLDFGLIGILSAVTGLLAERDISVCAVSTFNTDYFLIKTHALAAARAVFQEKGYVVV